MTTPATPTPAPIEWANLIQAGRDLLSTQQAGRLPTHEHIRRAESNAYYAMFHLGSSATIPRTNTIKTSPANGDATLLSRQLPLDKGRVLH